VALFAGVHRSAVYGSTGYIDWVETYKHEIVMLLEAITLEMLICVCYQ